MFLKLSVRGLKRGRMLANQNCENVLLISFDYKEMKEERRRPCRAFRDFVYCCESAYADYLIAVALLGLRISYLIQH
jgi:hypothetical protein